MPVGQVDLHGGLALSSARQSTRKWPKPWMSARASASRRWTAGLLLPRRVLIDSLCVIYGPSVFIPEGRGERRVWSVRVDFRGRGTPGGASMGRMPLIDTDRGAIVAGIRLRQSRRSEHDHKGCRCKKGLLHFSL